MTNRVALASQDFQKMCKQAERDQETRKLQVLMERVKRQIAERDGVAVDAKRRPAASDGTNVSRMPTRLAPFER